MNLPAVFADAGRGRDPTGTVGLRRSFRAAAKLRLNQLRAQMRVAVLEHDVLGFGGPVVMGSLAFQPAEVRMRAFAGWMLASAGQVLGGPWLSWWVAKAWESGEQAAHEQVGALPPGEGSGALLELAQTELAGIMAALIQALSREAARSVHKAKPQRRQTWVRLARAFDKIGPPRISALANTITVMGHNHGKLRAYRRAGYERVGVIPEHLPDARPVRIGDIDIVGLAGQYIEDPEFEVGVRTAGDNKVCQECEVFAASSPHWIDEVEDALPIHPNCRCTWYPWGDKRFRHDAAPFEEEKHPRQRGRWVEKGGKESPYARWAREHNPEHPGPGYSPGARLIKGVIHTSNVYDAQRALFEDRRVELKQIAQVSTLIKRLGETAKEMGEAGETAPVFNLCNVSIEGTNLFCAETLGIPRVKMPVIAAKKTKEFVKYLKQRGYGTQKASVRADHIRATQDQIDGAKVATSMARIDKEGFYKRLVVSRDNYILDGHHTWAAQLGVDARDGTLKDDAHVKITRVDISITQLLAEAETWTGGAGKKAAGQDQLTLDLPTPPPFEEGAHPRGAGGKWVEKGGGGQLAAGAFKKKALGEHKHFKSSADAAEHVKRVQALAGKEALRNHTYRWQMNKFVDEAKAFAKAYPAAKQEMEKSIGLIKLKIGESFWREAAHKMAHGKLDELAGFKMFNKAKAFGFEPTPEMAAKQNAQTAGKPASNLGETTGTISVAELALTPEEVEAAGGEQEEFSGVEVMAPVKAKVSVGKATAAELEKAKKAGPYYPPPQSEMGKVAVKAFNEKWSAMVPTTQEELEQKVAEYKGVKAALEMIQQQEATAAQKQAAEAKAQQAAAAKAEKAKAAAENDKAKAALAEIASDLGISPEDAKAVDALIHIAGKPPASIVAEFKAYEASGQTKGLPISPFEYAVLRSYVGSGYVVTNDEMRKGVWSDRTHVYVNAVNKGLSKMAPYNKPIKRGLKNLTKEQQAIYEPGKIVFWNALASCGKHGSFSGSAQFTIKPLPGDKTRARDLDGLNAHETGGEVLIMARSSFKVTKVEGEAGGDVHVWMDEVENI